MKNRVCSGFTLAEILITLSIIGVIAAMTLPNLSISINSSKTKSLLQKTHSDLVQALMVTELKAYSIDDALSDRSSIRNVFAKAMRTIETGDLPKPMLGANGAQWGGNLPYLTRNDGSALIFGANWTGRSCDSMGVNHCTTISVDLDGVNKGPGMLGSDIYSFSLVKNDGAYDIIPYAKAPVHQWYYHCNTYKGCASDVLYK